jgi:Histidine kinase-, DNA gyrase B-, and HSP90-like ATPase
VEETVSVEIGEDHLAGFTRSPRVAIAELVWNSLDADATEVDVRFTLNDLDGIERVVVKDNGTGMTLADASFGFRNFGNSWKKNTLRSTGGRTLHGKLGRGRYTAFSIGSHPVWTSVADEEGSRQLVTVVGNATRLRTVKVQTAPAPDDEPTGTTVTIDQLTMQAQRELLREGILEDLITRFAPYLEQYPNAKIVYRGTELDPARLRDRSDTSELQVGESTASLLIIEWKTPVERKLFLCDEYGSALADLSPGIHAPGYQFTSYLRWSGFQEIGHDVMLAELDAGDIGELVAAAKDRLRDYFKARAEETQREQLQEWDDKGLYPYKGKPASAAQAAERQAFDIVALSAAPVINEAVSDRSRKLTLRLIRSALESGPTALQTVLLEVLELPEQKVLELTRLLNNTTLSSVIETSKRIADRLDFLSALDALLFDTESRKHTLERRQLHRILAQETWVFGEEWALTGDDDRLTQVLANHLNLLGDDVELANLAPVLREDGSEGIPDLVLSRTLESAENLWQHLVVELKRPNHTLTIGDVDQIRRYAVAVSEDQRFHSRTRTGTMFSWATLLTPVSKTNAGRSIFPLVRRRSRLGTRSGCGPGRSSSATRSTGTSSCRRASTTPPITTRVSRTYVRGTTSTCRMS